VICVDRDEAKLRQLRRGQDSDLRAGPRGTRAPEPRREAPRLHDSQIATAVRHSSIIFIAVGTPQGEDGSADLQHVLGAAREIAQAMNGYKVIVDKSTVPVGTAEKVREVIRRETTHPFSVVSNPEFLKQGRGGRGLPEARPRGDRRRGSRDRRHHAELYAPFTRTGAPIMVMDCASAEMSSTRPTRCWRRGFRS
jgi:UDPglucose 6-dehydrogenase